MKQLVASSGTLISVGRLHPIIFAAAAATPAISLRTTAMPEEISTKLHHAALELGVAEAGGVAEALALLDGSTPPLPDASRTEACRQRLAAMVARLQELFQG